MSQKKDFINSILEATGHKAPDTPKLAKLMELMYAMQSPNFTPQPTMEQKSPVEATPENVGASIAAPQSKLAKEYPFKKR